jgi:hypothetical protein
MDVDEIKIMTNRGNIMNSYILIPETFKSLMGMGGYGLGAM